METLTLNTITVLLITENEGRVEGEVSLYEKKLRCFYDSLYLVKLYKIDI